MAGISERFITIIVRENPSGIGREIFEKRILLGGQFDGGAAAAEGDGMDVDDFESFEAADPKNLPSNDVVEAAVRKVGKYVEDLRNAPLGQPATAAR